MEKKTIQFILTNSNTYTLLSIEHNTGMSTKGRG